MPTGLGLGRYPCEHTKYIHYTLPPMNIIKLARKVNFEPLRVLYENICLLNSPILSDMVNESGVGGVAFLSFFSGPGLMLTFSVTWYDRQSLTYIQAILYTFISLLFDNFWFSQMEGEHRDL